MGPLLPPGLPPSVRSLLILSDDDKGLVEIIIIKKIIKKYAQAECYIGIFKCDMQMSSIVCSLTGVGGGKEEGNGNIQLVMKYF